MKVVQTLDPENDGIIHYEDFKKAFEGNINCKVPFISIIYN